jgi:hypothetical protein
MLQKLSRLSALGISAAGNIPRAWAPAHKYPLNPPLLLICCVASLPMNWHRQKPLYNPDVREVNTLNYIFVDAGGIICKWPRMQAQDY